MNETLTHSRRLGRRAGAFLVLSLIFFVPAILRTFELVDSGALRRVDVVLVLAGGFAAGNLFALAMAALRQRRQAS